VWPVRHPVAHWRVAAAVGTPVELAFEPPDPGRRVKASADPDMAVGGLGDTPFDGEENGAGPQASLVATVASGRFGRRFGGR
jgi:hypothetical protein